MSRIAMMCDTSCPENEVLLDAALTRAAGLVLSDAQARVVAHAAECALCGRMMAFIPSGADLHARVAGESESCLDENAIAEYYDGLMAWEDRVAAEAHLATCPRCLHQLAELQTLMVAAEPAQNLPQLALAWLRDGFKVLGATATSFSPVPLHAVPVLEGPGESRAMAWDLDSVAGSLRVTVQHDRDMRATLRITFLGLPLQRCRVHLRSGSQLLESRTPGQTPVVEFAELDVADYEVEIETDGNVTRFAFCLSD